MSGLAAASRRRGTGLWLPALIVAFIAVNARWIWVYRHGLPLDIDESGYLSLAVIDYRGLLYGGLHGWIAAIEAPGVQAPLTMALASLLFYAGGPHVILGFAVPLAAGAACVAAAYGLGRSVGGRRTGLLAAVLTASCPIVVNYSRTFQFSMPATLAMTLALIAIVRSRRFRSIGWALLFGLCVGLLPLARTMTLAFIPGLAGAAFVAVIVEPAERGRRLLLLAASLVLAAAVAATWLWPNGLLVAHYLFDFGYGAQSLEYGPKASKFGFDAWVNLARSFIGDVYVPHVLAMLLGGFALLGTVLRQAARRGVGSAAGSLLRSNQLPVALVAAEGILALASTANKGSGFFTPIVPALLVLTAFAFERLGRRWPARMASAVIVGVVSIMAAVPLVDLRTLFAPKWLVELPVLGSVCVTQGRGSIQADEAYVGYGEPDAVEPVDPQDSRAWVALSHASVRTIVQAVGQDAILAWAFRNALYNVNTVNLQHLLQDGRAFGGYQIEPTLTGESVAGYLNWLQHDAVHACGLLTSDRLGGDFSPAVNRAFMEEAARQADFIPARHWPTPDGQVVTLWKPRAAAANCHDPA